MPDHDRARVRLRRLGGRPLATLGRRDARGPRGCRRLSRALGPGHAAEGRVGRRALRHPRRRPSSRRARDLPLPLARLLGRRPSACRARRRRRPRRAPRGAPVALPGLRARRQLPAAASARREPGRRSRPARSSSAATTTTTRGRTRSRRSPARSGWRAASCRERDTSTSRRDTARGRSCSSGWRRWERTTARACGGLGSRARLRRSVGPRAPTARDGSSGPHGGVPGTSDAT